jgi:ribose 5-phosphate isomerase B
MNRDAINRVAIGSDHNGVTLAGMLTAHLEERGIEVRRLGARDAKRPVDYPPIVAELAGLVTNGTVHRGIVIGGTGSGESVAANKVPGIRAVLASDHLTARIARENTDAHILVVAAMVVGPRLAVELVEAFLDARFTGGRHVRRLEQIAALERGDSIRTSG